jgi:signal transduction histidine kinase
VGFSVADLRPSVRIALGLAVVALGFWEAQAMVQVLRSQARVQERAMRRVRESFLAVRPRVEALLRPGGPGVLEEAAGDLLATPLAREVEFFDRDGRRIAAFPSPSPVEHWPGRELVGSLGSGSIMVLGPFAGRSSRILAYASFGTGEHTIVLRLSTAAGDLVEDLRERRHLLLGHGIAVAILAVLGALALLPSRGGAEAASPRSLGAYEQAMELLRDRGQALTEKHEAERRRMEEEIRDKEAMARAGELTAGIVHEVRNGLGTIVGYARLLERHDVSTEAADAGRSIREECETLETVIRRFMDFVKRETLQLATFDLQRLLSRVVARESRSGPGGEVALAPGGEVALVGDEELLERAFENLIRNALEAAGRRGRVSVETAREGDEVRVTIADDGPGLTPAARASLRPFFSTKVGGLGLGLPIALKIVRLHGGDLTLEDRSPRGLLVTVRLSAGGARL